jgi:hypothetical protein
VLEVKTFNPPANAQYQERQPASICFNNNVLALRKAMSSVAIESSVTLARDSLVPSQIALTGVRLTLAQPLKVSIIVVRIMALCFI